MNADEHRQSAAVHKVTRDVDDRQEQQAYDDDNDHNRHSYISRMHRSCLTSICAYDNKENKNF